MYVAAIRYSCLDRLSLERRKGIIAQQVLALAFANYQWLCENPGTPRLYSISARYDLKVRPLNLDFWDDLVTVYAQRSGDCKDFCAIRLAECWRDGLTQTQPYVTYTQYTDGKSAIDSFHVQLSYGPQVEDPSALLGMPKQVSFSLLRNLFQ